MPEIDPWWCHVIILFMIYKMILFFFSAAANNLILSLLLIFWLGRSHLTKAPCWWLLKGCRANFINYFWPSILHVLLIFFFYFFLLCHFTSSFAQATTFSRNFSVERKIRKKFSNAATKVVFVHLIPNTLFPSLSLLLFVGCQ